MFFKPAPYLFLVFFFFISFLNWQSLSISSHKVRAWVAIKLAIPFSSNSIFINIQTNNLSKTIGTQRRARRADAFILDGICSLFRDATWRKKQYFSIALIFIFIFFFFLQRRRWLSVRSFDATLCSNESLSFFPTATIPHNQKRGCLRVSRLSPLATTEISHYRVKNKSLHFYYRR